MLPLALRVWSTAPPASVPLTHAVPLYFNTCPFDADVIVTSVNPVRLDDPPPPPPLLSAGSNVLVPLFHASTCPFVIPVVLT